MRPIPSQLSSRCSRRQLKNLDVAAQITVMDYMTNLPIFYFLNGGCGTFFFNCDLPIGNVILYCFMVLTFFVHRIRILMLMCFLLMLMGFSNQSRFVLLWFFFFYQIRQELGFVFGNYYFGLFLCGWQGFHIRTAPNYCFSFPHMIPQYCCNSNSNCNLQIYFVSSLRAGSQSK